VHTWGELSSWLDPDPWKGLFPSAEVLYEGTRLLAEGPAGQSFPQVSLVISSSHTWLLPQQLLP
jgi:hypothetical protein